MRARDQQDQPGTKPPISGALFQSAVPTPAAYIYILSMNLPLLATFVWPRPATCSASPATFEPFMRLIHALTRADKKTVTWPGSALCEVAVMTNGPLSPSPPIDYTWKFACARWLCQCSKGGQLIRLCQCFNAIRPAPLGHLWGGGRLSTFIRIDQHEDH